MTTTKRFAVFPFTYKGINFVSEVEIESSMYAQVKSLPAGVFDKMNMNALNDLATINENSTHEEIVAELERINDGGSYAFLKLAGE